MGVRSNTVSDSVRIDDSRAHVHAVVDDLLGSMLQGRNGRNKSAPKFSKPGILYLPDTSAIIQASQEGNYANLQFPGGHMAVTKDIYEELMAHAYGDYAAKITPALLGYAQKNWGMETVEFDPFSKEFDHERYIANRAYLTSCSEKKINLDPMSKADLGLIVLAMSISPTPAIIVSKDEHILCTVGQLSESVKRVKGSPSVNLGPNGDSATRYSSVKAISHKDLLPL